MVWHVAERTSDLRKRSISALSKTFSTALLVTRPAGTDSMSLGACTAMMLLVGLNTVASLIRVESRAALAQRLATMSMVNLTVLLAGGRTNLIANSIIGISLRRYHTSHRWLGRICVLQSLLHAALHMGATKAGNLYLT